MSEPSSVAAGHAAVAASSTDATAAAGDHTTNGSASDSSSAKSPLFKQIQQKYREEAAKRRRDDGLAQYVDLSRSDKFRHYQDDPWLDANALEVAVSALREGDFCKYLILGAGFGGLVVAVRLIQAGISVDDIRLVDLAGGFGGTWYWNRYPGLMCDIESYIYMPLLEEMEYMPKHKYAYGPELREYADSIADNFNLRDKTLFRAEVKDSTWDDSKKEWIVTLAEKRVNQEDTKLTVHASVVISTSGLLSSPHVPIGLEIEKFQGHSFHTSRWDYTYTGGSPANPSLTNLGDKRVGYIGTGATAVQAVPHLGKWAKELFLFQRTPSAVDKRDQHPTDTQWWDREIKGKKGWQRKRNENFTAFLNNFTPPPPVNMVADGWTEAPAYSAFIGGPAKVSAQSIPAHVDSLHALDFPRQQRLRDRIDEIVKDKSTAERLKAWYPTWCKRPCFHDDYLPTFNLPNVTLVDTDGKGVDRVTENGVVVGGMEYKIDLLILGTGYSSPGFGSPAYRAGMSVTGRNGLSLDQKWAKGASTLHGVITSGFPNYFWPGPIQAGATANYIFTLDNLATHIAYIATESERRMTEQQQHPERKISIESTTQAEEEWSMQILKRAATFVALAGCTPGWFNNEGAPDRIHGQEAQMEAAKGGIWGDGILSFVEFLENWRRQGSLRGLEITSAA